ncbi:MAG TPA: TIR domain-containing protein, partial [Thermoanaerobaculia bacterium]
MASGTRTRTLISRLGSWIFGMAQRVRFRYDFFISYAHGDGRAYADNLTRQLRDLDFVCFRDKDELPPGLVLRPSLRRAITASAQMIVVGSTDAIASDYVALEVETFSNTSRPIVPIDFGGTLTEAPWPLLRDQEVIWIDESPAALERGAPSPLTIAAVEKSFEFTKRNTLLRVRTALIAAIFVSGVAVAFLLLREEQRNASALTRLAETERIRAHRATARAMFERQVADRQGQIAAKNIKLARERLIDTAQEQGRLELLAGRSLPALLYLRDVYAARPQNEVARFLTRAATHGIVPEISPVFDRPKGLSFLEPVPGNLREASWSPGGDRILLRDARHTRVFDRQGRLLVALQRDGVPVVSSFVAFLDARRMLTADSVRASIWSTDGKLLRDVPLKEGIEPTWFALPLDRTTLVVSARGGVLFVPLSGGASRWVPVDKELYVVDRQGKRVAVIDGSSIRIRDLSSGTQSGTLSASRPVIWAFWSTGGDLLVAMHEDWTATLLRVEDAKARPLDGHTGEIRVVDFSPDGRWLVTGGEDGLLFLWDVDSLSDATYEPRALRGHTGIVHAAHFSPDSRRLLTATH